jgi:hypothetical protein
MKKLLLGIIAALTISSYTLSGPLDGIGSVANSIKNFKIARVFNVYNILMGLDAFRVNSSQPNENPEQPSNKVRDPYFVNIRECLKINRILGGMTSLARLAKLSYCDPLFPMGWVVEAAMYIMPDIVSTYHESIKKQDELRLKSPLGKWRDEKITSCLKSLNQILEAAQQAHKKAETEQEEPESSEIVTVQTTEVDSPQVIDVSALEETQQFAPLIQASAEPVVLSAEIDEAAQEEEKKRLLSLVNQVIETNQQTLPPLNDQPTFAQRFVKPYLTPQRCIPLLALTCMCQLYHLHCYFMGMR